MERIGGRLGPAYVLDKDWVEATERKAAQVRCCACCASKTNPAPCLKRALTPRGTRHRRWSA